MIEFIVPMALCAATVYLFLKQPEPTPSELGRMLEVVIAQGEIISNEQNWFTVKFKGERYSFRIYRNYKVVEAAVNKSVINASLDSYRLTERDKLYLYSVIEKKRKEQQVKALQELKEKVEK